MPTYDYFCQKCDTTIEIIHSIKDTDIKFCETCQSELRKLISPGCYVANAYSAHGTLADHKEMNHTKKVKDLERAIKKRRNLFGSADVGDPSDKPDPRHIVRRGKTIGGQHIEVDKKAFIKAAAKDDYTVNKAIQALKKNKNDKKI
jgi:putative FmdB family regulatory protein